MASASPEEQQHLHLANKIQYHYLSQHAGAGGHSNGVHDDNANHFEQLKLALKTVGLSKQHIAQIYQLAAAILHLGNLKFIVNHSHDMDVAIVHNVDVLSVVAEFLGMQASILESALFYKTKLIKKELCMVFLDPNGVSNNHNDPLLFCSPGSMSTSTNTSATKTLTLLLVSLTFLTPRT